MKLSVFYDHILQAAAQSGKSLRELLKSVRSAGIEAVEINMTYLLEHQETYGLLAEAGLGVSCVYEFYAMEQQDETEKIRLHIQAALQSGAKRILVVPGFLSREEAEELKGAVSSYERTHHYLDRSEKALRMADGLAKAASLGEAAGITVTIEDFDDIRSPISSVNGMLWFLNRIPQLKATFDTGNFIIHGEDALEAFRQLKHRIVHVHCKDRGPVSVAVGAGRIPIAAIVHKLRGMGYEGFLAIEHFDAPNQQRCIQESAAFLLSVLAEPSVMPKRVP